MPRVILEGKWMLLSKSTGLFLVTVALSNGYTKDFYFFTCIEKQSTILCTWKIVLIFYMSVSINTYILFLKITLILETWPVNLNVTHISCFWVPKSTAFMLFGLRSALTSRNLVKNKLLIFIIKSLLHSFHVVTTLQGVRKQYQ